MKISNIHGEIVTVFVRKMSRSTYVRDSFILDFLNQKHTALVLVHLGKYERTNMQVLVEELGIKYETIGKCVDGLEAEGLLKQKLTNKRDNHRGHVIREIRLTRRGVVASNTLSELIKYLASGQDYEPDDDEDEPEPPIKRRNRKEEEDLSRKYL